MIYPPTEENILAAAQALHRGELVAFPTETVYGLGAILWNEGSLTRIFEIKGRPSSDPLIVHLLNFEEISLIADISNKRLEQQVERLAPLWPGPLTLVLPKKPQVPALATAGLQSVAVRLPSNQIARQLLKCCGEPLAAPSANPFTYVSPTTAEHVRYGFGDKLSWIIDGGQSEIGLESTIVSLLDEVPVVLRAGAVSVEQLREITSDLKTSDCQVRNSPVAPGQFAKHYSPRTQLAFREHVTLENLPEKTALISFHAFNSCQDDFPYYAVKCLSADGNLKEVARNLFGAIREIDQLGLDLIVVESCPAIGIGRAIMDRLTRAAA